MYCPKSLLVGALSGVLSMLLGAAVARAECDTHSRAAAEWDAQEGHQRGLDCIVNATGNGTYEAECHPEPTDPSRMTYFEALSELDGGLGCEVVRTEDGNYEPQCDSWAHPVESEACGDWVDSTYNLDQAGMTEAYEACMTIALHTPGAVH